MVPRAKPVASFRDDIIAVSPPSLCHHERPRLSVIGFIVGVSSGNCRHVLYAEFGKGYNLELIRYRGNGGTGGMRPMECSASGS